MSLTSDLVKLVRNKTWTDTDLEQTSLLILDAFATACAGSVTPVGKSLIQWSQKEPLNNRTRVFLLGALTHITETDDLHRASVTHPGCIVVPCILVLSRQQKLHDEEILLATLRGFEAMCRIGNAVGPAHYRVWHNTATCGPFGSAVACAEMFKLTDQQTVYALGNAGTQSSGLWQFLESGSMSKHLHAGRGSEAGLLAAELAQLDFTGPADILEGDKGFFVGLCPDPQPEHVLAEPDAPWQLNLTSVKPWPSCRHTHPSIDAALEIHSKLGNRMVNNVRIETYEAAINLCDRVQSSNEYQAKFSLQHCVAKALSEGKVGLESFDHQARSEALALCDRTQVICAEPYMSGYPQAWGARVCVTTSDGELLEASRQDCKGDPELPLSRDEMLDKAHMLMRYAGFSGQQTTALCNKVLTLAKPDSSSSTMTSAFLAQYLPFLK